MSLTCGFYNSLNEDRVYDAVQLSSIFDGIIYDGVFMSIGDKLMVKVGSGMNITVGSGRAWFNHSWTRNDADYPLTVDQAEVLLSRIDIVVLEINSSAAVRNNPIKIIKGSPSSSPVAPTLIHTDEVNQYPLAIISIPPGLTQLTQANLTNKVGTSDCPFVTGPLQTMNIDALVSKWESEWNGFMNTTEQDMVTWTAAQRAAFDAWFAEVEDTLDENVAGNLLNIINAHKNDTDVHIVKFTHAKNGTVHNFVGDGINGKAYITDDFIVGDTFTVNGTAVTAKLQNGESPAEDFFKQDVWVSFIYDESHQQINFSAGGAKKIPNTLMGRLVISLSVYDGGDLGTTRVRIKNESLGMNLIYTPDAIGRVSVELQGNKTYSIDLINVPAPYYGEATTKNIAFDSDNAISLQLKGQPDIIGFRYQWDGTPAPPIPYKVEYIEGAIDWIPMSMSGTTPETFSLDPGSFLNSWLVKDIRPCAIKDGVVQYYYKRTGFMMFDYSLQENGLPAKIDGSDGNVMIEFPRIYISTKSVTESSKVYCEVRFAKYKVDSSYFDYAWQNANGVSNETMYLSRYKANSYDGLSPRLRSVSRTYSHYATLGAYRSLIAETPKNAGYHILAASDNLFLQLLFLMTFKTFDYASCFGYGNTSNMTSSNYVGGKTDNYPLCFRKAVTDYSEMSFFGLENLTGFNGGVGYFVDGVLSNKSTSTPIESFRLRPPYTDTSYTTLPNSIVTIDGDISGDNTIYRLAIMSTPQCLRVTSIVGDAILARVPKATYYMTTSSNGVKIGGFCGNSGNHPDRSGIFSTFLTGSTTAGGGQSAFLAYKPI